MREGSPGYPKDQRVQHWAGLGASPGKWGGGGLGKTWPFRCPSDHPSLPRCWPGNLLATSPAVPDCGPGDGEGVGLGLGPPP